MTRVATRTGVDVFGHGRNLCLPKQFSIGLYNRDGLVMFKLHPFGLSF